MNSQLKFRDNVVDISEKLVSQDEWQVKIMLVAKNQDRQAFSELFAHFAPKLKAFALIKPYSYNPSQFADDLIQEVMIKVWNKAGSYNPSAGGVSTWIFTVARNCRIDMIRKNNRNDYPLESDELFDMEDENLVLPFQALQQQHYEKDLRANLNKLPHEQAQIIAKVYLEGKSHNEVAEELDLPLGTVKSRVRLALTKLKVMVAH